MQQRQKMRQLFRHHNGNEEACIRDYAAAELRKEVPRRSNRHQMDPDEYARRLFYDGMKRGWIKE